MIHNLGAAEMLRTGGMVTSTIDIARVWPVQRYPEQEKAANTINQDERHVRSQSLVKACSRRCLRER